MIRRKSKGPGADGNAPANPRSASAAPPPGSVPAGGDEPPPTVIHELLAAFSAGGTTKPPPPPPPPSPSPPAPVVEAVDPPEPPSAPAADRVEPAPPARLAEPTRRSARRSRKEAKREAKRERKRLAEHEKAQKKARKQTSTARRKARRQGEVEGSAATRVESEVRIITPDDPSVPPVLKPPPPPPIGAATIQIAGDDLPDAIYVEGDLAVQDPAAKDWGGRGETADPGATERSTVFIDEDPVHADVVTMDVATSAARMEPRIRERRIAVKRAVGRRRLKWAAIVTAVVLIGVAVFAVLGSSLFTITTVRVDGRAYSNGPLFDAVIESLEGSNVLRVDTEAAERQLELIPWVADARVTTDFPNGAIIEVREREPSIAYQGTDGRYRVLDSEGRVLDVIAGQPVAYLELFVPDAADLQPGAMAPRGYRAAATMVQALTPQMRTQVISVSTDAEATDLRMILHAPQGDGSIEVRFGEAEDLVDKLVRLQTALTDPDPEEVPTEMIDVSGADLISR